MHPTRERLIKSGHIKPNSVLASMYKDARSMYFGEVDNIIVGPSYQQPWHQADPGLRMDGWGRFYADADVQQSVMLDYEGQAPSLASSSKGLT